MAKSPPPSDNQHKGEPKHFVLDTNVLLHNPNSLFMFDDNEVVIPFTVLEELDKFKKENTDVGRNARQVIRHLDGLRVRGPLGEGVQWNGHGGRIRIDFSTRERPDVLKEDVPDNRIVGVAWGHANNGHRTIFISKDINVRLKADALGITTQDFEAQKVDADRLYSGYLELLVPGQVIDALYEQKHLPLDELKACPLIRADVAPEPEVAEPGVETDDEASAEPVEELVGSIPLFANQFVQLRDLSDPSHSGLARILGDTEELIPIHGPRKPVFGVMARNVQQTMAFDLLLDDDIRLVTLIGNAGTGKTLLAIAAGMTKVAVEERYDKLLVARPIMPMGRDIGYLPGDKDEKLSAWMQPIFDNLSYIFSTRAGGPQHADSKGPESRIKEMMNSGHLVLEPLTYIRGRSIPHQFIIIDEAQNLTPHEVKTIVSRVGEGTKIILTGDVNQIDNPYLDSASNGLAYLIESLKGESIVGTVTLQRSERSQLASLAAARL